MKNLARLTTHLVTRLTYNIMIRNKPLQLTRIRPLQFVNCYTFSAKLPTHEVLSMPALSPTMKTGKILKWNKKVGDKVESGDVLCQVETDKATVAFELTEKGYIARILIDDSKEVPVGEPVAIVVNTPEAIKAFQNYKVGASTQPIVTPTSPAPQKPKPEVTHASSYPAHQKLTMPALSPTMKSGKILKWNKKQGDSYQEGQLLCQVQTDKAVVGYESVEKGILAKILIPENTQLPVGALFAISVKNKEFVSKFANYSLKDGEGAPASSTATTPKQTKTTSQPVASNASSNPLSSSQRIFISPIAKVLAHEKNIPLHNIKGSGPNGRILKQDVQGYKAVQVKQQIKKQEVVTETVIPKVEQPTKVVPKPQPAKKNVAPENPFEEIQLTSMRKTIAARLTQSKSTVPHYYISADITMDETLKIRQQLNKNQKENGTKISVNDIIIKATALALRDYPDVNSQWNINTIRKFRYADVSMAVSTDTGLLTPIIFRADTKGLLEIARNTKDLAKRARQGKLQPHQFIGGTASVSNLGMYGIDQMLAVINPPQSIILGVGKTDKKILFDQHSKDPNKPYKVANVMNVTVSADHRVVDGALASLWIMRLKKYLENPYNLIL